MQIVWLRRDLRTIDNSALNRALATNEPVVAVYVATPEQWASHDMAPIQADLIYRRLFELQKELLQLNIPLCYGQTSDFTQAAHWITDFAHLLGASRVLVNNEYEINEIHRDELCAQLLQAKQIEWLTLEDKCVLAPGSVRNKQGEYFKVFTPFKRAWLTQITHVTIEKTTAAPLWSQSQEHLQSYLWSTSQSFDYPRVDSSAWSVEFDDIRQQLRDFCRDHAVSYQQERDFPALESTSRLSPYLALGFLSVRQCLARLYAEAPPTGLTAGAETWLSELIWREFYQHLLHFEPKLCRHRDFSEWGKYVAWSNDESLFQAWCEGRTGYPIVDAAMRQLNSTGWMHNRLRMIVASFLTKDLHIDWRWGEKYFMSQLIDGDFAANNGGWQWCASTGCDGQPYFRIFNPTSQGEKFDADGHFIRHWIPELNEIGSKWLHQPWLAPNFALCGYPKPIVDHKAEREVALASYKHAKEC
ncbi:deoxyribodipyrimidine photo-lyase [Vibrio porteresiae]|uniref:Deoxyribodipyrimidine photo-lyase n=1 Tax=Vibrio porteresiae DSM 19223 TaxID=1123496 RepID=A0ABZ0QJK8_9VIBR|nr:deoxyribodipyrimidine photo-lyase [Vibrio porteresiae]WPC76692.1 deoxyribodipyrimidine photo-lyase [Vibrio porteresiae DSM 19223]